MVNGRPAEVARAVVEATAALGVPVVVNTSWGGLELDEVPAHVCVVNDVPYDWLFSRVRAVVHHGGSGTTHSALRFNLPQLIVPHIADQFFWARCIVASGLGPAGFPIKALTEERLQHALEELLAMDVERTAHST